MNSATANYRPDIDGLRAAAIIPVLVFHLHPGWLPGGYLGVDVFFVISGYLITSILLREMAAGSFRMAQFWARRVRRIMPALLVVTATTMCVASLFVFPPFVPSIAKQALSGLLSCANVYLWRTTGNYWGERAEDAPFLHMWSLSLEEQFYLLFPLLLCALRQYVVRMLVPVLMALVIGSFVLFMVGLSVGPTATFYLPPTRAWELGVGACLAALGTKDGQFRVHSRVRGILASIGLAVISASYFLLPRMGPWAAVPVVATGLIIAGSEHGACGTILSQPVFVWIGRLSYSLYLWHWPVLVLSQLIAPGTSTFVALLVTIACSVATYMLVEEPARRFAGSLPVIGVCYAVVVCVTIVLMMLRPVRYDTTAFEKPASSLPAYDIHPGGLRWDSVAAFAEADRGAVLGSSQSYAENGIVVGAGDEDPDILVFGDSHGAMFADTIRAAAERLKCRTAFYCIAHGVCPFPKLPVQRRLALGAMTSEEQYRFDVARVEAIDRWRPRVVILCGKWSKYGDEGGAFLEYLDRRGVAALLFEEPPRLASIGKNSVVQYLCWKNVTPMPGVEYCLPQGDVAQVASRRAWLRETVASHPNCRFVPTFDLYARGDQALVLEGRKVIYLDDNHLTTQGTERALPRIIAALAEALACSRPNDIEMQ